jgi:hypothetical protein
MDTLATTIADDFADACFAFQQGRLKQAADAFARIAAADATHAESVRHLGLIAHRTGHHAHAAELISQAILLNPGSAQAFADLVQPLRMLGQYQSARKAQQTAAAMGLTPEGQTEPSPLMVPDSWRHVHLVAVEPDNYAHAAGLMDFMTGLAHAFVDLGCDAEIVRNRFSRQSMNLVFGAHLINSPEVARGLPANSVIVNLEQLRGSGFEQQPVYLDLLTRFSVWDYSPRNIVALKALTGNARVVHMGIGYAAPMTRLPPVETHCADVLFYGSLNERRRAVLRALEQAGLRVRYLFGVYGPERDQAVAEAKMILNMHFYEGGIHELVRTSHLLANAKAVVSECNVDTEIDEDIRRAMLTVPYDQLIDTCVALARDDERRLHVEQTGFAIFARRSQWAMLARSIAATTP